MAWQAVLRYGKSFATGFIVGLPIYVTISDYGFCVARVDGISMQPSLNPVGNKSDVVLLDRWTASNVSDIKRGDVVSLISPTEPDVKLIKRVIGLEGDVIKTLGYKKRYVSIPKGHCWLEGDHRGKSFDSNSFGPVSLGLVNGLATRIIWPPKRWMKLERTIEKDRTPLRRSFNDCTFSDMLQNRESSKRIDKGQDVPLKDEGSNKKKSIDRRTRELLFREGVSNTEIKEDSLKDEMEDSLNDRTGHSLKQENNDLPESKTKSSIEERLNLAVDESEDLTKNEVVSSAKDELRYVEKINSKDKESITSESKFDFGTQGTKNENDDSVKKINDKVVGGIDMKFVNNEDDDALTVEEYEKIEISATVKF